MRRFNAATTAFALSLGTTVAAPQPAKAAPAVRAPLAPDRFQVPLGAGPVRGPAAAKVTVLAFLDYECPFSAKTVETLDRLSAAHPSDLRLQIVHSSLPRHPAAPLAARAALAAGLQGKFWPMHARLFENQADLGRASLERHARALALDVDRFRRDLDGPEIARKVEIDSETAKSLRIDSTPTYFVNGRRLVGAFPLESLEAIATEEIARANALLARGVPAEALYNEITKTGLDPLSSTETTEGKVLREALATCVTSTRRRDLVLGLRVGRDGSLVWPGGAAPGPEAQQTAACLVGALKGVPLIVPRTPRPLSGEPTNVALTEAPVAGSALPPGWFVAGSQPRQYDVKLETRGGRGVASLRSVDPTPSGFVTLMQQVKADAFRGKRVRFRAPVEAADVRGWAGLWMRVDPELGFDNMRGRPIKGGQAPTAHEVVLDVPANATVVAFGILLEGPGQVWMGPGRVEVVDAAVAVTGGAPKGP